MGRLGAFPLPTYSKWGMGPGSACSHTLYIDVYRCGRPPFGFGAASAKKDRVRWRLGDRRSDHPVITTDREDFQVYRRNKREVIPLICPLQ